MADLAIGGALASLKAAGDLASSFLKMRDIALVQGKVIELQSVILSAQQSALAAQGEQFALLDEKRGLERHIAELEAWDREKNRYELKGVGNGCFAYLLKPGMENGEPTHSICKTCYEQGRKSILDSRQVFRSRFLDCHSCKAQMLVEGADVRR